MSQPSPSAEQPVLPPQQGAPLATAPAAAKGLAVSALVVGIVAFLFGLAPVFGLLAGATAIALGAVALKKGQSKGLALTGLILGGIAALTSLLMTIMLATASSQVSEGFQAGRDAAQRQTEPEEAPKPTEPEKPVEPEKSANLGTKENPYPQPYTATGVFGGEKYSLTTRIYDANAGAALTEWNMFNTAAPSGYKHVVIEVTMTGIDPDGVEPSLASFDLQLATADGNRYDEEHVVLGDGMFSMSDGPKLYPGSTFTGFMAFVVPESIDSFLLYDNGNYIAF